VTLEKQRVVVRTAQRFASTC